MKIAVGSLALVLPLLLAASGSAQAIGSAQVEGHLLPQDAPVSPVTIYMPACDSIDAPGIVGFFAADNLAAARASCGSFEAALRKSLDSSASYVFAPGYSAKEHPGIDSVPVDTMLEARAGSRYRLVVGVPDLQHNVPGKYLPVAYGWRMSQDFRFARIDDAMAKAVHFAGSSGSPADAGEAWGEAMVKGLVGPRCEAPPAATASIQASTRKQAIEDWHCDSFAL